MQILRTTSEISGSRTERPLEQLLFSSLVLLKLHILDIQTVLPKRIFYHFHLRVFLYNMTVTSGLLKSLLRGKKVIRSDLMRPCFAGERTFEAVRTNVSSINYFKVDSILRSENVYLY